MPHVVADFCSQVVCHDLDSDTLSERYVEMRVCVHGDQAQVCVKAQGAPVWEAVETVDGVAMRLVHAALGTGALTPDAMLAAD